jgi:hypothetical protein
MEFNETKPTKKIYWKSHISTIMGGLVAIAIAWDSVDWQTFEFDSRHLFPLFLSAMVALGGYMTSINTKP